MPHSPPGRGACDVSTGLCGRWSARGRGVGLEEQLLLAGEISLS